MTTQTDFTAGLVADFWDDDVDSESLTHTTLADAVEYHVEQECGGVPPNPIWSMPAGWQPSPSSDQEMRISQLVNQSPKEQFLECLRVLPRRSFFAFKRSIVSEPMVESIASDLAERTLEYGLEEMVDPDGLRPTDKVLQKRLAVAFGHVLRDQLMYGQWRPWHCEQVGQVTLTAVQMEALMREHCPHWFD